MSFHFSHFIDVLDGVKCHHGDDAVDGERGEDEEEGRAEEETLHFCGGGEDDDDTVATAASASLLVTNPLTVEASLSTSCTLGAQWLTKPGPEPTSLGKITSLCGAA